MTTYRFRVLLAEPSSAEAQKLLAASLGDGVAVDRHLDVDVARVRVVTGTLAQAIYHVRLALVGAGARPARFDDEDRVSLEDVRLRLRIAGWRVDWYRRRSTFPTPTLAFGHRHDYWSWREVAHWFALHTRVRPPNYQVLHSLATALLARSATDAAWREFALLTDRPSLADTARLYAVFGRGDE